MFTEIISTLDSLDTQLFTWLNSFHSPFFDTLMWTLSAKETWIPLYICITVLLFVKNWKQALIILLTMAICITLADQISSTVIKEVVARPRPSHNDVLTGTIHILNNYRGSPFGFVSSHAANTFAFITLLAMIIRNHYFMIVGTVWASAVTYSRIYLGVHYPGDIIGGIAVGVLSAMAAYTLYKMTISNLERRKIVDNSPFGKIYANISTLIIGANLLTTIVISIFML